MYVKAKQIYGLLYLLFSSSVFVVTENATLQQINNFDYSNYIIPNNTNRVGLDVDKNYFTFFINFRIYTYRLNCINQYETINTRILLSIV
jgi:hypothetical protein